MHLSVQLLSSEVIASYQTESPYIIKRKRRIVWWVLNHRILLSLVNSDESCPPSSYPHDETGSEPVKTDLSDCRDPGLDSVTPTKPTLGTSDSEGSPTGPEQVYCRPPEGFYCLPSHVPGNPGVESSSHYGQGNVNESI